MSQTTPDAANRSASAAAPHTTRPDITNSDTMKSEAVAAGAMETGPGGESGSGPLLAPVVAAGATPRTDAVPHAEGVSDDEFRAALARLAAGVVLVTAYEPPLSPDGPRGEDAGMTATAFMSVSLDPPLVLVSVRNGSRMDDLLLEQPLWAASLLAENQRHIAGRFAMKGRLSDRLLFQDLPCRRGEVTGAPLVEGSLAALECRTEQRVVAGDHTLVIGRVLTAWLPAAEGGPLTYYKGRYRQLDRG